MANKKTPVYTIRVWEPEYDADDVPLVDGIIPLTDEQEQDLTAKLERFAGRGLIDRFEIDRYDDPEEFAIEGVYKFITGDIDNDDADLRALWHGV